MQDRSTHNSKRWLPEPRRLRTSYLATFEHRELIAARSQRCVESFLKGLPIIESQIKRNNFSAAEDSLRFLLLSSGLHNAWRVVFDSLHAGMEFCMKLELFAENVAVGQDAKRCLELAYEVKVWGRQTRLTVE